MGALLFYMAVVIFPRVFALFWFSGIQRLLYEDLAFSHAWSSFLAMVGSFVFAVVWVPLLRWTLRALVWKFNARQIAWALMGWMLVYGHVPLLHALLGSEVCVNQRTGEPLKWYVTHTGGQIVLFDSPGYDSAGREKHPATPHICRILQLQKRGIRPRAITDDPRSVQFFDEVTGQPRVWYHKSPDGRIDLFDGEGTHPIVGEPLLPITKDLVQEAHRRAEAQEVEATRAAQLKAARAEADAREQARKDLIELFGVASYPDGVVIIGATAEQKGDLSSHAAVYACFIKYPQNPQGPSGVLMNAELCRGTDDWLARGSPRPLTVGVNAMNSVRSREAYHASTQIYYVEHCCFVPDYCVCSSNLHSHPHGMEALC